MTSELPRKEVIIASQKFPFSDVVRYGNLLFVSGAIGRNPENGEIAINDLPAQTRQTLVNIQKKLERAGSSLEKALKVTIFILDMGQFSNMNTVYREFFPQDPPARSCVGVSSLPDKDALIEIEMVVGI